MTLSLDLSLSLSLSLIARSTTMNFVDVCGHMPILLDFLPPASIPALSATCSTLRLLIRYCATSLTVTSHEIKDEPGSYAQVKLLTCGPQWRCLQVLRIEKCVLNSLAVGLLSRANIPSLHKLSLRQVSLKTGLVRTLLQAKWTSLRHLDLSCNKLAHKSFGALVAGEAGPWHQLEHLNLNKTNMSDRGLQELCRGTATTSFSLAAALFSQPYKLEAACQYILRCTLLTCFPGMLKATGAGSLIWTCQKICLGIREQQPWQLSPGQNYRP